MGKVLFIATVVKTHIMQFHIPYLKMFKEMGYEVSVAARNDYDDPDECAIPYCDRYYDIPFERSPLSCANIKAYKQLKKIINDGGYDIIHCHTPVGGVVGRLAAKKARKNGTRVFYTAHGFHFYKGAPLMNWILYYPIEKYCSRFTDVLITINHEDYALAQKKMHAKRVEYVPGVGIDTEKFKNTQVNRTAKRQEIGVPENAFVLISVGELNKNKNHQIIIKALAEINNDELHYVIAGQGVLKERLLQLAEKLGVSDRVHLLGYRTDVAELYKAADVFCFPSKREGLGLAALEAMACRLPLITSFVGGIKDYAQNNITGFCITNNSPKCYAKSIQLIYNNKALTKSMCNSNLNLVQKFDINVVNKKMKVLYCDIK